MTDTPDEKSSASEPVGDAQDAGETALKPSEEAKPAASEAQPAAESKTAAEKPAPVAKKPAAPKAPLPAAKEAEVSRRGFFSWAAVAWVGFAVAIGGCLTAWGRFMFPNVLYEPPTNFKVGPPSEFPIDSVDERFTASQGVWIVNEGGRIYAIIAICTHLGCPPNWLEAQNKFKCPCHGSGYYRNGINFEGPTPRPLERAAVSLDPDDGQILVDKAQKFLWERGQWDDPASYLMA